MINGVAESCERGSRRSTRTNAGPRATVRTDSLEEWRRSGDPLWRLLPHVVGLEPAGGPAPKGAASCPCEPAQQMEVDCPLTPSYFERELVHR